METSFTFEVTLGPGLEGQGGSGQVAQKSHGEQPCGEDDVL